jgi:hypothetical protein
MARMVDHAQLLLVQRGTLDHTQEARSSPPRDQTVKQAMTLLNIVQYSPDDKLAQINDLYKGDQVTIREDGNPVIKLHEHFAQIYCNPTARAAMANLVDVAQTDYAKDKSVILMDCRASTIMTGSLLKILNCADIEEKITSGSSPSSYPPCLVSILTRLSRLSRLFPRLVTLVSSRLVSSVSSRVPRLVSE